MDLEFKLRGQSFFVQEFKKIKILILKIDTNILLALTYIFCIFLFFKLIIDIIVGNKLMLIMLR